MRLLSCIRYLLLYAVIEISVTEDGVCKEVKSMMLLAQLNYGLKEVEKYFSLTE